MRPHRHILTVRVKSALTRRRILLPFHQRRRPPTTRSRIKTSRTPQRRRPCHVNSDETSPLVCNGSGSWRNILRLSRRRPSLQHMSRPWACSGSNPDHNKQWMMRRHFKQHRQANTVEGHGHAILLGKMHNRKGTIQIIVAIWSRKSCRLLHKTARTSTSQKQTTALRNQLTCVTRL